MFLYVHRTQFKYSGVLRSHRGSQYKGPKMLNEDLKRSKLCTDEKTKGRILWSASYFRESVCCRCVRAADALAPKEDFKLNT